MAKRSQARSQRKPDANDRTRAAEALRMRTAGATFAAIAAALHYRGESGARMAVERLLGRVEYERASELRRLEGHRLD